MSAQAQGLRFESISFELCKVWNDPLRLDNCSILRMEELHHEQNCPGCIFMIFVCMLCVENVPKCFLITGAGSLVASFLK